LTVDPATNADIWILPMSGGKPFAFLKTEFNEMQPAAVGRRHGPKRERAAPAVARSI